MPVAAPPATEYKTIPLERASVKASSGGAREFTGYASRWDEVDFMNDRVRRGAFSESLRKRSSRPLLWNHDPGMPVGYELDLVEDRTGLKGTWRLSKTAAADDAYELLRDRAVTGLSIGFIPRQTQPGPDGTRELLSLDLLEISIVSIPALDSARIVDVKSAQGATMNTAAAARMAARSNVTPLPINHQAGSLGQMLVQADEYKRLLKGTELNSEHSSIRLRVELPDVSLKALTVSYATGPTLTTDTLSGDDTPPLLVDLLPTVRTDDNAVRVAQLTSAASAAAVAEATATTGTSGTKSEAGMAWSEVLVPVETVSAWLPVTRAMLSDAAGFQALADSELAYAVRLALEAQVLSGDGVRPNLQGFSGMSGVNTVSMGAAGALPALAEGISTSRKQGRRQPNVIVMDADSWEALSMARENTATGTLGGSALGPPGLLGLPSLWGIPVLPSAEIDAGTALIGARSTASVFEHLGITIVIGTIGTQFVRNMVMMRAEIRATLGVRRPASWTVVSGLPT